MSQRQLTKDSQARTLRGWMLGLHATHIIDVGGRLGYFSALRQRDGWATAAELATAQDLDPWRTAVWCKAACTVGILRATDETDDTCYSFAPFMDELLADNAPDLLTSHVLASLARDYPGYPEAFRTGATTTFHDHDEDFFAHQGRISALRAPLILAAARKLPGVEERLSAGGTIMDIGSGSGTVLVSFAEAFPGCQVIGIEPLPYFVHSSRQRLAERGLAQRVRVESVGGEGMDFEQTADLITMVQVFHELPDTEKIAILRRCHHALKPGGSLLLVDRCAPESAHDIQDRRFSMSILEQWFEVTWGNIVNTRSEILAMLHQTGFSVSQENPDMVPTYWSFVADKG